jgi:hypothetical protein
MAGACVDPFDDCNGVASDGCEANLAFDETDCDVCGASCGSGEICNGRQCYADCGGVACMSGCGTSRCMCNSGTCGYFCSDPTCDTLCQGSGITCTVLGNGSDFDGQCRGGAQCIYDMRYGPNVAVRCENASTECSVDCRDATSCDVDCRGGAECEVRCNGPGCGFSHCEGSEDTCGGGRRVCNRAC